MVRFQRCVEGTYVRVVPIGSGMWRTSGDGMTPTRRTGVLLKDLRRRFEILQSTKPPSSSRFHSIPALETENALSVDTDAYLT